MSQVAFFSKEYPSHFRQARVYARILSELGVLVDRPEHADVLLVQGDTIQIPEVVSAHPALRDAYKIMYGVCDTDRLPDAFVDSIDYVDEIWVPSRYTERIFSRYHSRVFHMPHVADRDGRFSPQDLHFVRQLVSYRPECFYFLNVSKVDHSRKNIKQLLRAFNTIRLGAGNVKLIVKNYVGSPNYQYGEDVCLINESLTEPQLNALYSLANVYVMAHHAEGWGLTLSDAMALGVPLVATAYSGSLDYMNEQNSWLVSCTEEFIRPEDLLPPNFNANCRWAYPHQEDLEKQMLSAKQMVEDGSARVRVERAKEELKRFSEGAVKKLVAERLAAIPGHSKPYSSSQYY